MKKIPYIICIVAVMFNILPVFGQTNIEKIYGLISFDDQLIKAALDSSFFIIRQDYVLKSTSAKNQKEFGRGGNDYFGRIYGFAVLSDNILWTDFKMKKPWLYDDNYKEYESSDTLVPVLKDFYVRRFNEKYFIKADFVLKDSISPDLTCYVASKQVKSIASIPNMKDSMGWMVIAFTKENIQLSDSCDVYLYTFRPKPQYKNNGSAQVKVPQKENILGGGYFTANISLGVIRFYFAGLLYRKAMNWIVIQLPPLKKEDIKLNEIKNPVDAKQKQDKKGKKGK